MENFTIGFLKIISIKEKVYNKEWYKHTRTEPGMLLTFNQTLNCRNIDCFQCFLVSWVTYMINVKKNRYRNAQKQVCGTMLHLCRPLDGAVTYDHDLAGGSNSTCVNRFFFFSLIVQKNGKAAPHLLCHPVAPPLRHNNKNVRNRIGPLSRLDDVTWTFYFF